METELVMENACCVCGKELNQFEGFKSSSGEIVCSEDCKSEYLENKKPKLTVYSRVTGYCTPVSSWNKGKLQEFKDRVKYGLK